VKLTVGGKLDIVVGSMKLEDQFEWDLDNVNASPEQFAEVYGADLGLTGEYKCVAHGYTIIFINTVFI
jgi:SWI/SNF-related matrix-associated actin-dependent regulator of chromatin subfamily B member 1